jgi:hypothetical protein
MRTARNTPVRVHRGADRQRRAPGRQRVARGFIHHVRATRLSAQSATNSLRTTPCGTRPNDGQHIEQRRHRQRCHRSRCSIESHATAKGDAERDEVHDGGSRRNVGRVAQVFRPANAFSPAGNRQQTGHEGERDRIAGRPQDEWMRCEQTTGGVELLVGRKRNRHRERAVRRERSRRRVILHRVRYHARRAPGGDHQQRSVAGTRTRMAGHRGASAGGSRCSSRSWPASRPSAYQS